MNTKRNTNRKQLSVMVDFMKAHKFFAQGTAKSPEARLKANVLWDILMEQLNSLGPPIKTIDGWRKVWKDFKYHTKTKLRNNVDNVRATGEEPSTSQPLSASEEGIVTLLWPGCVAESDISIQSVDTNYRTESFPIKDEYILPCDKDDDEKTMEDEMKIESITEVSGNSETSPVSQHQHPTSCKKHPKEQIPKSALKLREKQIEIQKKYFVESVELLRNQNVILSEILKTHKTNNDELKKIRKIKEEKLRLMKKSLGKF